MISGRTDSENAQAKQDSFGLTDWLRLLSTVAWLIVFVIWPRITLAVTLLIVGGVFIAFNAMIFWATVIRKGQASSVAPIFGGIFAAMGIALLPVDGIWKWAWIPLVIDWGGIPIFLHAWLSGRSNLR